MVTRVSTFASQNFALQRSLQTQEQSADLSIQVSSGKVSRDYKGIATDSRRLLTTEVSLAQDLRFIRNIDTVDRRLEVMEQSTATSFDIASELRTLLMRATSEVDAADIGLAQRAEEMLRQVASLLNSDLDGSYLFAGSRTDTPPVDLEALFNPEIPLVDAVPFTGAATVSTNGLTDLPGVVSLQVDSGSDGQAYQVAYSNLTGDFTVTNLNGGAVDVQPLGTPPGPGATKDITFDVGGERVVLTVDANFNGGPGVDITTFTPTFTAGAGTGSLTAGLIDVTAARGDITKINDHVMTIGGAAANNATLTLASADGNFSASGIDLSTLGTKQAVLTNATTGAELVVRFDVDGAFSAPDLGSASIELGDFFENLAATAGFSTPVAALPGEANYDPADPSFYRGDDRRLNLRAEEHLSLDYGVTAIDSGFEKLIRSLWITRQAAQPGEVNETDLEQALGLAIEAIEDISQIRSGIGSSRSVIADAKQSHENATLLAENTISDIENTDVAKTLTLLSQNAAQIEASFATLGRLTAVSLLDFI